VPRSRARRAEASVVSRLNIYNRSAATTPGPSSENRAIARVTPLPGKEG